MKKDELFNCSGRIMPSTALVEILLLQMILFALVSTNVCAQEKVTEIPKVQQYITVSDSLVLIKSDSLKLLEAKRIYELPLQNFQVKKVQTIPIEPITEPKNN